MIMEWGSAWGPSRTPSAATSSSSATWSASSPRSPSWPTRWPAGSTLRGPPSARRAASPSPRTTGCFPSWPASSGRRSPRSWRDGRRTMTTTSETWAPPTEFAEDLYERYGLTCPPRWGTPRHPEVDSLGPAAWRVMEKLGFPPMPWQKYVLDVALEIDPATGVFAHREVGLSVPRQQGKTQQI